MSLMTTWSCRYGIVDYAPSERRRKRPAFNADAAARYEHVAALRAEGRTHAEIAKAVGLSKARIWQILNRDLHDMRIRQRREVAVERQRQHYEEIRSARHLPYPTDVHTCALLAEVGALLDVGPSFAPDNHTDSPLRDSVPSR